ncbi:hypothetical protein COO60DRAFT_249006 [Scenedesmus sp. NREL 46B-D3]|nr:hypothetical protein COO60DRAFT_249006 [Scenedesmus sp. NREL 46B-D3]
MGWWTCRLPQPVLLPCCSSQHQPGNQTSTQLPEHFRHEAMFLTPGPGWLGRRQALSAASRISIILSLCLEDDGGTSPWDWTSPEPPELPVHFSGCRPPPQQAHRLLLWQPIQDPGMTPCSAKPCCARRPPSKAQRPSFRCCC